MSDILHADIQRHLDRADTEALIYASVYARANRVAIGVPPSWSALIQKGVAQFIVCRHRHRSYLRALACGHRVLARMLEAAERGANAEGRP